MTSREQMPMAVAQVIAERFQLLGDPMRIRILDELRDGPLGVGVLTARVGTSQQNVSKHLGLLHRGGLVARERQGTVVRYAIADRSVFALCEDVCGGIRRHLDQLQLIVNQGVTR